MGKKALMHVFSSIPQLSLTEAVCRSTPACFTTGFVPVHIKSLIYELRQNYFLVSRKTSDFKVLSSAVSPPETGIRVCVLTGNLHRGKGVYVLRGKTSHKNIKNTLIYVQLAEELFKRPARIRFTGSKNRSRHLRPRGCRPRIRMQPQRSQDP
jgi:hypothetical protein